jgi:hypothetical protein
MTREEAKETIIQFLKSKTGAKSKFYLKDFYSLLKEMPRREVNNIVNEMVREGTLEYWSSGSTTLLGLKGEGKQHSEEG